jgi:hypothetical protein
MQITVFQDHSRALSVPTSLQKLVIDVKRHAAEVQELGGTNKNIGDLFLFRLYDSIQL